MLIKKALFCLLIFYVNQCFSQTDSCMSFIKNALKQKYIVSYRLERIDTALLIVLKHRMEILNHIAAPNKPYLQSDVIYDEKYNYRLIRYYYTIDMLYFIIVYESYIGGYAVDAVLFKKTSWGYTYAIMSVPPKANDIKHLLKIDSDYRCVSGSW